MMSFHGTHSSLFSLIIIIFKEINFYFLFPLRFEPIHPLNSLLFILPLGQETYALSSIDQNKKIKY
jgi:hypothetical protein